MYLAEVFASTKRCCDRNNTQMIWVFRCSAERTRRSTKYFPVRSAEGNVRPTVRLSFSSGVFADFGAICQCQSFDLLVFVAYEDFSLARAGSSSECW